ncbi:MAG: GHKL domain-containing protein [Clostridium sp.]|nr:GHKL domain-containing protein [Clostridium sp.]
MELIIKSVILSFFMGMDCKLFFEALLPRRPLRFSWLNRLLLPSFMAGFLLIAFTPIPPYIFQPIRFVFVVALVAMIYFQVGALYCAMLSVLLCNVYWTTSALLVSVFYLFPTAMQETFADFTEYIADILFLCLMLIFRCGWKRRTPNVPQNTAAFSSARGYGHRQINSSRTLLYFFPLLSIVTLVSMILTAENQTVLKSYAMAAAVSAFAAVNICFFYFLYRAMEKEEELQRLRLIHEQTQNQMNLYRSMQKSYELQRRQLHDYKNQLECIQGMLKEGKPDNALSYVSRLTGVLSQSANAINTNHNVVNIMLNRKYQEAREKKITMTFAVNDLSSLAMSEEEIVILLGNLLDNAIAACEKLDGNKIIQFKMVLENGQLILSVRNPVKESVPIKENKVVSRKTPNSCHGIGLLNVDSIIQKHGGTSVITCDNGWFYFSAMIP